MRNLSVLCFISLVSLGTFFSCTKNVYSGPNFVFKPAPSTGLVAKIGNESVTEDEVFGDVKSEIYEAEKKLYDLKFGALKAKLLKKMIDQDPRKKNLTNDQFLEKFIASKVKVSDAQVSKFSKERKIPKKHLNAQMTERIKKFLAVDAKKKAIDLWMGEKTAKNPVEVYLRKPKRPVYNITAGNAPFTGNSNAKVTIVEYSDFQCPFCVKGAKVIADLKKKYGNKVKIAFKNFPLPFHSHAKLAAEASLCAFDQGKGKFWKMHDAMFADQAKLDRTGLVATAKSLGMNSSDFEKCIDSHKHMAQVDKDIADGKKNGVKSTPTFFVNGQLINGAHPIEVFSEIIDAELKK